MVVRIKRLAATTTRWTLFSILKLSIREYQIIVTYFTLKPSILPNITSFPWPKSIPLLQIIGLYSLKYLKEGWNRAFNPSLRKFSIEGSLGRHVLVLVLPTFTYGIEFEEANWKTYIGRFWRRAWSCIMTSQVKVCSLITYHILLTKFGEPPVEIYTLKLTTGFQQHLAHLPPHSWLVSKVTSLFWYLAKWGFNT